MAAMKLTIKVRDELGTKWEAKIDHTTVIISRLDNDKDAYTNLSQALYTLYFKRANAYWNREAGDLIHRIPDLLWKRIWETLGKRGW